MRTRITTVAALILTVGICAADYVALPAVEDADVYSLNPTTNYGGLTRVGAGHWLSSGTQEYRAFVKFDLSSIPSGSVIDACTLRTFDYFRAGGLTNNNNYIVRRVTGSWSEMSVTWNTQPTTDSTSSADTIAIAAQNQNCRWDVTKICSLWVNGTANNGLRIHKEIADTIARCFFASREYTTDVTRRESLEVYYTPPGAAHITNIARTPTYPLSAENIGVSAKIWLGSGIIDSAAVSYSNDRVDWTYTLSDSSHAGDSVYFFRIPPRTAGDSCHYRIQVWSGGVLTTSSVNSLKIPWDVSIHDMQRVDTLVGDRSPYADSFVHTAGIVTGVLTSYKCYIGTAAGDTWNGIVVNHGGTISPPLSVGDSIDIVCRDTEYYSVTELRRWVRVDNHGSRAFDTATVTVPGARLEAYEGALLRLDSVFLRDTAGSFVQGTNNWLLNAPATESIVLYIQANSSIVNTTKPKGLFSLVANGHQYNALHEVIPRAPEDIIYLVDVQALAKPAPPDTMAVGDTVSPRLVIKNTSATDTARNVMATFRIDSYNDSKSTAKLGPGETDTLVFSPYTATVGAHAVTAFADYTGDINRHNDTLKATVFVPAPPPPPPGGWAARTPMPSGAKAIKDGGWLAHDGGTHLIYASRGTKQPDFFSYNPANDSWKPLAPWQPGVEGKLPQKGSAACADGDGIIYATKGNNTLGFWAYNAGINVWTQKKDIPLGLSNKRVKGGTDLVFVAGKGHDTDYVYLLKGYKNEFYRYNTATDSWQTMTSAPVGGKEKWDKGSWLVEKKAPGPPPKPYTIYAHKAKYHEFYAYNTANDSWSPALQPMPTAGSAGNKKSKDGSCAALLDDSIYALKGGNTREFWRYSILDNAWAERETIPTGPFKKKVKAGSDIVTVGDVLYATKGNKSNELWMYTPSAYLFEPPRHDGVLAKATGSRVSRVEVSPNPLTSGFVTVHFTRPLESSNPRILLSIYNVAGQWIAAQTFVTGRSGVLSLDLRHLSNGVYLLEFSSGGFAVAQKLIVER